MVRSSLARLSLIFIVSVAVGFANSGCKPFTYHYTVPPPTGDGWETGSLDAAQVDPVLIRDLMDRIHDKTYKNIHGILLVKDDKLVLEEYFPGHDSSGRFRDFNRTVRHETASVTKSVNSILVGIAIDQGLINGVDENIATLLPQYRDVFATHPGAARLRLKDLLTMSAGFSWDEWTYPYSDPRNDLATMWDSKDPARFVLTRSAAAVPGARFVYSGGLSFLLGEIVHCRSDMQTDEFARRFLFRPLGITNYFWWKNSDGAVDAGGGLVLRPRDMAKIGALFLNGGRWRGRQVVSQQWVTNSIRNYVDARQFPSWIQADGYGYQWWLRSFRVGGATIPSYHAAGHGGQFIFVFPTLRAVAVFTGWNDDALGVQPFDMVQRHILPALLPPLQTNPLRPLDGPFLLFFRVFRVLRGQNQSGIETKLCPNCVCTVLASPSMDSAPVRARISTTPSASAASA